MVGIIDVGGGMRCVYTSGIYDRLLDENIMLPYCLGVSAGAANLITYIAKQKGRTLPFYREYAKRKEYMSLENLIKTGSYISLDYVYSVLSNEGGENPLDYETFSKSDVIFKAAATRARDGKAEFFDNKDVIRNDYSILKASCCLPGVCKPTEFKNELYFDGGVAEPIPVEKAFSDGCDKVILVLTKSRQEYMTPMIATKVLSSRIRKYPEVFALMRNLHNRCTDILTKVSQWEKEGKVLVIEPENCFGMNTLTRDYEPMTKMYEQGCRDAKKIMDFLEKQETGS
ncbi:MAG: patatin family protein [Clostridia bacterium]|nr:patatin family protein [Clostridia bacterium]